MTKIYIKNLKTLIKEILKSLNWHLHIFVCVCVCVCEREREREMFFQISCPFLFGYFGFLIAEFYEYFWCSLLISSLLDICFSNIFFVYDLLFHFTNSIFLRAEIVNLIEV